ncbi:unnamed protein product [Effrenium voratum]|nr:unnamed protein product [Effrenium voratum]
MGRRLVAEGALRRLLRCDERAELARLRGAAEMALERLGSGSATACQLLEGISEVGLLCVELAEEVGVEEAAEPLCDALCAVGALFAAPEEAAAPQDRSIDRLKFEHRSGTARFLEPLGAALDGLVLDISQSLARAEEQLRWQLSPLALQGEAAAARRFEAICAVCAWLLAIAARGSGGRFTAEMLWDFANEDALSAVVFAKGALCFQQGPEDADVPVPEDLPELRDAALGALLGLCAHGVAFRDCLDPEENIDISIRNEQLALHRATVAAAAARQQLMPCLLAYPWATGLTGPERLPELVGFLRETLDSGSFPRWSPFLESLGADVDAWRAEVRAFAPRLWDLADLAPPKRGVLRDLAALAKSAPPSEEPCLRLLSRCLGFASGDPEALAALLSLAQAAGMRPGGDALSAVLAHLDDAQRQAVARRLTAEEAQAWAPALREAPPEPPSAPRAIAEPQRQDLRALLAEAPAHFCCQLDGRLLVDPVRTPWGHLCERSVLAKALEGGSCPFTGAPLQLAECQRDADLRKQIREWVRSRPGEKRALKIESPVFGWF